MIVASSLCDLTIFSKSNFLIGGFQLFSESLPRQDFRTHFHGLYISIRFKRLWNFRINAEFVFELKFGRFATKICFEFVKGLTFNSSPNNAEKLKLKFDFLIFLTRKYVWIIAMFSCWLRELCFLRRQNSAKFTPARRVFVTRGRVGVDTGRSYRQWSLKSVPIDDFPLKYARTLEL